MRITVVETSATAADIAGYAPLAGLSVEVIVGPRPALTHRRRPMIAPRRRRTPVSPVGLVGQAAASDLVEVSVVRSPRNRAGGGARARPAL
jgi:hypothetical protein